MPMTPTTKKRGGPQPGSGRPPKSPADKVVKCKISMTKEHHAATEGDRSGIIRKALEMAPPKEFDYCIVGKLESISVSRGEWTSDLVELCFISGASCRIRGEFVWPIRIGDFVKVVSWKGEVQITNLSNPPLGYKQSEK